MRPKFFETFSRKKNAAPNSHNTFSDSLMDDSVEMAEKIIGRWASSKDNEERQIDSHNVLFSPANRLEAQRYIQAVTDLRVTMEYLLSVNPRSEKLVRSQMLLKTAIKCLEKEFFRILMSIKENLDTESLARGQSVLDFDSIDDRDSVTEAESMTDLKLIADCLISAGHAKGCLKIYANMRKSFVDDRLSSLGVEKLSFSQLQKMEPEVLDLKIKTWLRAVKIVVSKLFHNEKILCDHVFSNSAAMNKYCFTQIIRDAALKLFALPASVGKFRKTPELLFCTLDIYETISILLPQIDSIFCYNSTASVRSHAAESLTKLGESASLMIEEFESAIQNDTCKEMALDGGVHPLTRYVMNYTSFVAEYTRSVPNILKNWPLNDPPPLPESYIGADGYDSSPITVRLAWQILVLLCKIDGKTQAYKDPAISYLFLANNLHYVVARVRNSNLKLLLGGGWLERHEEKVKQYLAKYEKLAWGKTAATLPENPAAVISPDQAKDCFKKFNDAFDKAYKKQSTCVVPDWTLREQIRTSLTDNLIPGYRAFYETNLVGLEKLVKFTPEDINNYIANLFADDTLSPDSRNSLKTSSFYLSRRSRFPQSRRGGYFLQ